MPVTRLSAMVIGLASLATPGLAQGMTDAELLRRFEHQRDAFSAARQGSQGKTRGLTLITVDNVQATTLAPLQPLSSDQQDAAARLPGSEGGVTVSGAPDLPTLPDSERLATADTTPLIPPPEQETTPVVYGTLDPALQVNVQIRFPFDSASLTPDQTPVLTQMCNVMRASDIALFRIIGHTDASGQDAYNQRLSQLRAEEVQRHLVGTCGIAPDRLEALGLGETFLRNAADPNGPENRRVEFQALG